jgi:hypothetical protein
MKEFEPLALEKHKKYKEKYGENDTFWGFGIEVETYLQFSKPIFVAAPILRTARKPERYSVSYYKSYKPETLALIDKMFPDSSGFFPVPLFVNSHGLTRIDKRGNHQTTYEREPKPNPAFLGKTIFQELQEFCPDVFVDQEEVSFTFDGDAIEFMTQDFYKIKIEDSIEELLYYKKQFLDKLNKCFRARKIFLERGALIYPPKNPGFVVFNTNPSNIAMFNNGTYHINITLPTEIGYRDMFGIPRLKFLDKFRDQHKSCIRVYQWLEPILIAMYGTPDPFDTGSRASQRCAMSRYIGIGTYNTETMLEGKVLTLPIESIRGSDLPYWWYSNYHSKSAYNPLTHIGMDILYKKHYLHGIELRIFDWFPEERLQELCELLVYAAAASLDHKNVIEPAVNRLWNEIVVNILRKGKEYVMTLEEVEVLESIFLVRLPKNNRRVDIIYKNLFINLKNKYSDGALAEAFLTRKGRQGRCC